MPTRLCTCGRRLPCALHPRAPRHKTRRTPPPRGSAWRRIREVVLYRDGHRCQRCRTPDTPSTACTSTISWLGQKAGRTRSTTWSRSAPCVIRNWSEVTLFLKRRAPETPPGFSRGSSVFDVRRSDTTTPISWEENPGVTKRRAKCGNERECARSERHRAGHRDALRLARWSIGRAGPSPGWT